MKKILVSFLMLVVLLMSISASASGRLTACFYDANGNPILGDCVDDGEANFSINATFYCFGEDCPEDQGAGFFINGTFYCFGEGCPETNNLTCQNCSELLERVEELESSFVELEDWKISIMGLIEGILQRLLFVEEDVETLEDNVNNISISEFGENTYLEHLRKSDKKRMLCGFMEEDMLTEYSDLGLNCTASYKTYRSGRVRQRCRCK